MQGRLVSGTIKMWEGGSSRFSFQPYILPPLNFKWNKTKHRKTVGVAKNVAKKLFHVFYNQAGSWNAWGLV